MTTHDQEAIAPPPGRYSGSNAAARTRCAALRALSAVGHGGQARLGQHPAGKLLEPPRRARRTCPPGRTSRLTRIPPASMTTVPQT